MIDLARASRDEIQRALNKNFKENGEVPVLIGMKVRSMTGGIGTIVSANSGVLFMGRPLIVQGDTYTILDLFPGQPNPAQFCVGTFVTGSPNISIGGKLVVMMNKSTGVHAGPGGAGTVVPMEGAFEVAQPLMEDLMPKPKAPAGT